VRLENVQALYGIEIYLHFDPQTVQVIDARLALQHPDQEGVQIHPGDLPTADYVLRNEVDNDLGQISYAATQLPPSQPGQGEGIVAQIALKALALKALALKALVFKALEPATTSLRFERFLLTDTEGQTLNARAKGGRIVVARSSTWVLYFSLGAALALGCVLALAITKRRRADERCPREA
jgi:hypothetical protein